MRNSHMPNESIGAKKPPKNGHVIPSHWAQISILQVDFLEILNNSRTRNENFDQFFDPEEPENNSFELIPEHQKIMVLNWGYYHPIRRCIYGTLARANDP